MRIISSEFKNALFEIKNIVDSGNSKDVIDTAIGILKQDPSAIAKLIPMVKNTPLQIRENIYLNKFIKFVQGVEDIQENLQESVKLSEKLFSDEENGNDNAIRILNCIEKIDSEKKVDYMISATRSFLLNMIDVEEYFRILKVITETLYEDLLFLKENIIKTDKLKGNRNVLALSNAGLAIQCVIDSNVDIEEQFYNITKLGMSVDKYAISIDDDKHRNWHKNNGYESIKLDLALPTYTTEEIDEMVNETLNELNTNRECD